MVIMIHSYMFELEYKFSHVPLTYTGKKIGHRHSISNMGSQKDSGSLPGHTWFWNLARLQMWNGDSCFLGNSLGMKTILILIIKSQWKIYSSDRCLIESGLLEKYRDTIYCNRTLKGHQSESCRNDWLLLTQPCFFSKVIYFFSPSS